MADLESLIGVSVSVACQEQMLQDARVKKNAWSKMATRVDADVAAKQDSNLEDKVQVYHLYTGS